MGPKTGIAESFVFSLGCLATGITAYLLGYNIFGIVLGTFGISWFALRYLITVIASRSRHDDSQRL